MNKSSRKILIIVVSIVIIFFGGRYFIYWKIKDTIIKRIDDLKSQDILVKYSSIDVNSWKGNLSIKDLEIETSGSDSVCSSGGTMKELVVEGISVIPLLINKKLTLESVILKEPWIQYSSRTKSSTNNNRSENQKQDKATLKGFEIGSFRIDSGKVEMVDSASCSISMKARFNFQLENLSLSALDSDSAKIKMERLAIYGIVVDLPTRFYHLTLNHFSYSRKDQAIQVDSLRLVPTLGRKEFARRSGHQVDQFTLNIPSLSVSGYKMSETIKQSFIAGKVDLNFAMEVYRDKRFPRPIKKSKVLPVAFLHKLPFVLNIDSLHISKSLITYHEHPEKGEAVGKISFNDLDVGLSNISNDSTGESVMKVETRFMNAGDLNVDFTFPHEKHKLYGVRGSLTKFSMPEINVMLEPAAHIRIESGKMQTMKFHFQYDSKKSDGELELRYTDLKVLAIKDDEYKTTNKIVTLIIGALVKKKIDINDPKDKRTGVIAFERDPQKAVLNYWWKSVLSGIKSVFGFETSLQKETEKKKNS